jgi:hypothetical protein
MKNIPPLVTIRDHLVPQLPKPCALIIKLVDCYVDSQMSGEYATAFQRVGGLVLYSFSPCTIDLRFYKSSPVNFEAAGSTSHQLLDQNHFQTS